MTASPLTAGVSNDTPAAIHLASLIDQTFAANSLKTTSFSNDEELLNLLAVQAASHFGEISSAIGSNLSGLGTIPAVGDEILAAITPVIRSANSIGNVQGDTRQYLRARGIEINSVATAQEVYAGTHGDLLVLTMDFTQSLANPLTVSAAGNLGSNDGIRLTLDGTLTVTPDVHYQLTFGLDHEGRFFIVEGATVHVNVTADGELHGTAHIPNLADVTAQATSADNRHLFVSSLDFLFSDFDAIANERFYLAGVDATNLAGLLADSRAVDFAATADAEVQFQLDNPLSRLPAFLSNRLQGLFPSQLTWSADVHIDAVTQAFDLEIQSESIAAIASLLGSNDSLQDALFQLLIDEVATHNPLPDAVQTMLGTKIPILEQSLLDLLDVPEEAQFLIAPEAFRGKPLAEVARNENGNRFDFGFDLFEPINLTRLLSGQSYEILSLDLHQRFQADGTPITVMPETLLFSYLGIANVTMEVNLIPSMFFEFDVQMGIDTQGFYVEADPVNGVSDQANITFGGGITGQIVGEGDLFFVLDLVRVTAEIGLEAFGGFTFITEANSDTKLRQLTPANLLVTAGLDLNLGLKGEVGLLDFGIQRSVQREIERPLYRYEIGTMADIQDQLNSFKEQFQREGKLAVYAGAPLDPHIAAAAAVLLYQDLQSIGGTARAMIQDLRVNLTNTAKILHGNMNVGLGELVRVLKNDVGASVADIGKTLFRELNVGVGELTGLLRREAAASAGQIAQLLKELGFGLSDIARNLFNQAGASLQDVAGALGNLSRDIGQIAAALNTRAGATLDQIAATLYRNIPWTNADHVAQGLGSISRDVSGIANALKNNVSSNLNTIASSMWSISWTTTNQIAQGLGSVSRDVSGIANALKNSVSSNLNTIAASMYSISWTTTNQVAQGLGSVSRDVSGIANALKNNVSSNLNTIASSMWSISWTTSNQIAQGLGSVSRDAAGIARALSSQLNLSYRSVADVMWNSISWTSANDVARGIGALTTNVNSISDALQNGARLAASTVSQATSNVARALGLPSPSGGSVQVGGISIRW
ncbi:methyl-accepting chemotaxis protein [Aporhodopirellula aestuarii]|uniref:Uncharacterized protein n=1 Tax=Aporhodopirellula aestuarii TaxID=2950107 RepID=A0ABT0TY45_9BACT|nr:hypothetical protein [Aporhodopirellula aestuarii]MCM2369501.1 hypothetical protein [Aporhodopirellula aestuarii]